jgi:hypothetical protein
MRTIYVRKYGVKEDATTQVDLTAPSLEIVNGKKVNVVGIRFGKTSTKDFPANTPLKDILPMAVKAGMHLDDTKNVYDSNSKPLPDLNKPISAYGKDGHIEFDIKSEGGKSRLQFITPVKKESVTLTQEELYELENINFQVSYMKEMLEEVSPNLKESVPKEDIKIVIEKLKALI